LTLEQLKKILRAARGITEQDEFYVIGSAAILGCIDSPENHLLSRSIEADLIAINGDADLADLLSVMIGELSPFHDQYDVYADGVTFDTPKFAPKGWQERAIPVHYEDIGVTARFMDLHDLLLSKLGAGRPKDLEFCQELVATGYVQQNRLLEFNDQVECDESHRLQIRERIIRFFQ
jgi:hypothetical protein